MWGYTEIGVGIHGWVRMCCLCSTFTTVFTGGLVLDASDRTEKVLVVEVPFIILQTKCLVPCEFSHSTVYCTAATLISHVDTNVYRRLADGNPADTLSHRAIH